MVISELATLATLSQSLAALWLDYIWPILMLVIGLGLVIFVHELGHFLVAKMVGIRVERFALGFGPRLFGIKRGETDYCVNLLPLGGYVKMVGQEDFKPLEEGGTPDPRAYNNKSVGARFAVISAGVIMNVILAAVLFIVVCLVGIQFVAPVVGGVSPGKPAASAPIQWQDKFPGLPDTDTGLKAGDKILELNGKEVTDFAKIFVTAALSSPKDTHTIRIERTVDGQKRVGDARVGLAYTKGPSGADILAFGIERPTDNVLGLPDGHIVASQFRDEDEVVALNGKPVAEYWELEPLLKKLTGQPVAVSVLRKGQKVDLSIQPSLRITQDGLFLKDGTFLRGTLLPIPAATEEEKEKALKQVAILPQGSQEKKVFDRADVTLAGQEALDVAGLIPRLQAEVVLKDHPAANAGVQPGDIVLAYGDRKNPTHQQFLDVNKASAGASVTLVLLREGKTIQFQVVPEVRNGGSPVVGIQHAPDVMHMEVAGVRAGSPAAKAGLLSGDVVRAVNGKAVSNWHELVRALAQAGEDEVVIRYARGDQEQEAKLGKLNDSVFKASDYQATVFHGFQFRTLMGPEIRKGPVDAIVWGVNETGDFILRTYLTLRSLMQRTVSTREVMGPVGMASIAIDVGRESIVRMIYFMAMISVSLAVINFLPFPVVDGGHAVFLILEKIRGKPLPVKVMNIVQLIGIAILLFVFVAVTFQDIMRLI